MNNGEQSECKVSDGSISHVITGITSDPITQYHLKTGEFYEVGTLKRLVELIDRFMDDDDFVVDAGANIGNHSLYFGDGGRSVFSFEMNPKTFSFLERNIMRAGLKNITAINKGLSDREQQCGVKENLRNPLGGASVDLNNKDGGVNLIKLDSYFHDNPQLGRCCLLKLDVEGHELQVLSGARGFLVKYKPLIFVELKEVDEFSIVCDFLSNIGYVVAYAEEGLLPNFLFVHKSEFSSLFSDEEIFATINDLCARVVGISLYISQQVTVR